MLRAAAAAELKWTTSSDRSSKKNFISIIHCGYRIAERVNRINFREQPVVSIRFISYRLNKTAIHRFEVDSYCHSTCPSISNCLIEIQFSVSIAAHIDGSGGFGKLSILVRCRQRRYIHKLPSFGRFHTNQSHLSWPWLLFATPMTYHERIQHKDIRKESVADQIHSVSSIHIISTTKHHESKTSLPERIARRISA